MMSLFQNEYCFRENVLFGVRYSIVTAFLNCFWLFTIDYNITFHGYIDRVRLTPASKAAKVDNFYV